MSPTECELAFPRLRAAGWQVTSPEDRRYNCIAWAAGDKGDWWWPDPMGVNYWPDSSLRQETVAAFVATFRAFSYRECVGTAIEEGFEKVALYAKGTKPTHMARQLEDGRWSSKLGRDMDIAVHTLDALEGDTYGKVVQIMRRRSLVLPPLPLR